MRFLNNIKKNRPSYKRLTRYSPIVQETMDELNAKILKSDFIHLNKYPKYSFQSLPSILFEYQNRTWGLGYNKESTINGIPLYGKTEIFLDFNHKISENIYIKKNNSKKNNSDLFTKDFYKYFEYTKMKENVFKILFSSRVQEEIMGIVIFLQNRYSFDPWFLNLRKTEQQKRKIEILQIQNNHRYRIFFEFSSWIDDYKVLIKLINSLNKIINEIENNSTLLI